MSNPIVSIIVPAYNHENYIEECFDSIINQTYSNIELIVLNDGSTDKTHYKIKGYISKLKHRLSNVIYVNKDNEGVCKTLNKGIDLSTGKYIIPFASDDVMFPERVKLQVDYLEKNQQFGMIYSDGYDVFETGKMNVYEEYDSNNLFSSNMEFKEGNLFEFMLTNVFLMPTPTICIRKICYDVVGKYDENLLCEDPDMFLRIAKYFEIGCIREPLVLHRVHTTNSGKNIEIIRPSIENMFSKYKSLDLFNSKDKLVILNTLARICMPEKIDYSIVKKNMAGKKLIGWGAGETFLTIKNTNKFQFDYLVDGNPKKHNTIFNNLEVYNTEKILEEKKEKSFVIICSLQFQQIAENLNNLGFKYKENYY